MERNSRTVIKIIGIIILIIFILFQKGYIFYIETVSPEKLIDLLKIEIVIFWILTFWILKKKVELNNPIMIFFLIFSLFNFFRIFLDLFNFINFADGNFMKYYRLSLSTQIETLEVTLYSLLGFFVSFIYLKKNIYLKKYSSSDKLYRKISYIIMIGLGILSFYSSFKLGINIFENGYEYLLSGESDSRNLIMRIADEAFPVGYYLFLATNPSKKEFKIMTLLFFLFQCLELLKGARSLPMANLLVVFYVYFEIFNKKLSLKKAILTVIMFLFFASLVGDLRSKQKFSLENFKSIAITQTITYTIIGQSIDEKSNLSNFNFYSSLYEPLEYWKGLLLNNLEMKRTKNLKTKVLADNLAYNLNSELYLEGFGLGTNPIAEVNLEYGKLGVFILFILMGVFIEKLIRYSEKGVIQKFIFLSILPYLFLLGRNSYFFIDITKIIKIYVFAFCIKIVIIILRRKNYE